MSSLIDDVKLLNFKDLLNTRAERLNRFTEFDKKNASYPLLHVLDFSAQDINDIKQSVNIIIWSCLKEFYPDNQFVLCPTIFEDNANLIRKLPNITPNGLLLPKNENIWAYNIFHKTCAKVFSKSSFFNQTERLQFPINIRIVDGNSDSSYKQRPRASTKVHTDIWASEPSAALMGFLSLLGDTKNISVHFLEPTFIPPEMIRPLDDYDMGKEIADAAIPYNCQLDESGFFIVDPYLLHQTVKNSTGLRLSIDFRFLPRESVSSDFFEGGERSKYFLNNKEWCAIGKTKAFYTNEKFKEFFDVAKSTYGYAVNFQLITPNEEEE